MSIILHVTIAASTFVVPFRQRTLHSHRTCVGAASDVSSTPFRSFSLSLSPLSVRFALCQCVSEVVAIIHCIRRSATTKSTE